MNETQRLFNVIAILTQQLGGKVEISYEQLENPPEGMVTRDDASGKMIIEVRKP